MLKKKKIAFVGVWCTTNPSDFMGENNLFMAECFYRSAKKFFMVDQEVDFLFLCNNRNISIDLEDVRNIHFQYSPEGYQHLLLMKILSLRFIDQIYDYIFVCDLDSIFISPVGDEILGKDFYLMKHYFSPSLLSIHGEVTKDVVLNFDPTNKEWTMGNFFGGKFSAVMELLKFSEEQHQIYKNVSYPPEIGFYARYPDELFLLKFIFEKNIEHERLIPIVIENEYANILKGQNNLNYFLSDFPENESLYPLQGSIKCLHNTKKNIEVLKKIINFYAD